VPPPRRRSSTPDRLTIGAVIAALRADFPDVSVSKIRFLEAAGLVHPARTPSGYRVFTAAEVDRIRYILTAQRDRFWPLKVIREALDALDRGLTVPDVAPSSIPEVPAARQDPMLPTPGDLQAPLALRLTGVELRAASELRPETFRSLQEYGLLPHAETFDEADLAVARAAGALAAYGVEARHLRAFRNAADREIGLVEQVVAPALAGSGRTPVEDPTTEVLSHCIALHVALVRAGLRG
jgi:DNA-binding transcriptional MerR regulator